MNTSEIYQLIQTAAQAAPVDLQELGNQNLQLTMQLSTIAQIPVADPQALLSAICSFQQQFSEDGFALYAADPDKGTAKSIVENMVWRVGLLNSIFLASGGIPKADVYKLLPTLVRSITPFQPNRPYFIPPNEEIVRKLLVIFQNTSAQKVECVASQILHELGFACQSEDVSTCNILSYGHPIDSSIVRMLDTPVINDAFRRIIDWAADAEMGPMLASSIPVNEVNYPKLNKIVDECVQILNIKRPYVVVTNHISGLNAMTFGSDEEPYIAVTSLLVKVMQDNDAMMRFVIGHECGHIAMGHVLYHTVVSVLGACSQLIPGIGPMVYNAMAFPLNAWSRRSEITADRAGLLCCGNLKAAQGALLQLESAFTSAADIDINTYIAQSRQFLSRNALRKLGEFASSHPLTPKRIQALEIFAHSKTYAQIFPYSTFESTISKDNLDLQIEDILRIL